MGVLLFHKLGVISDGMCFGKGIVRLCEEAFVCTEYTFSVNFKVKEKTVSVITALPYSVD